MDCNKQRNLFYYLYYWLVNTMSGDPAQAVTAPVLAPIVAVPVPIAAGVAETTPAVPSQQRVINEWKVSKTCHAHYYGQIVDVPCPNDGRVIRGKPSWMAIADEQWFRTSPIVKWNRNSADELISVETNSHHTYHMGTKYSGKKLINPQPPVPLNPAPTFPTPAATPPANNGAPQVAPPPNSTPLAYDIGISPGNSLISISADETMEFIVDPNNKSTEAPKQ